MSTNKRRWGRVWLAAVLAPLAPSVIVLLLSLASNPFEGMWAMMLVLPASYATVLVPGMPLYLLFRRISWDSAFGCVVIGIVCSSVATFYFMRYSIENAMATGDAAAWGPSVSFAIFAAILGAASGFAFWRIAYLHGD